MAEDRIDRLSCKRSVPIPLAKVCVHPLASVTICAEGPLTNQNKGWVYVQGDDPRSRDTFQDASANRARTSPEVKNGEARRHPGVKNIYHQVDSGEAILVLPQLDLIPVLEQVSSKTG